jgi:hypothetical protein
MDARDHHVCTTADCPFVGQPTTTSCGCHVSQVDFLRRQRNELLIALDGAAASIRDAEKDTNWISGGPYAESLADEYDRLVASMSS